MILKLETNPSNNFFTITRVIQSIVTDYQKGSARVIIRGDDVGLAEIGSANHVILVEPTFYGDWLDEFNVAYPDLNTLLTDLKNGIFKDALGASVPADQVTYDNTTSGLTANDVQAAIDEVSATLNAVEDAFTLHAGRSQAATTDVWLRRTQNLPLNLSPYVLPFNADLIAISCAGNSADTWDAEVYRNAFVRAGGVPLDTNKDAELQVVAANQAFTSGLSVNFNAGDEIGIFMRGTAIDRPSVTLIFRRR